MFAPFAVSLLKVAAPSVPIDHLYVEPPEIEPFEFNVVLPPVIVVSPIFHPPIVPPFFAWIVPVKVPLPLTYKPLVLSYVRFPSANAK